MELINSNEWVNSNLEENNYLTTPEKIIKILLVNDIKTRKKSTAKEIAETLKLSSNLIRNHLTVLEKQKYITRTLARGKTGRPSALYSLNSNALELFPKRYDEFSVILYKESKKKFGVQMINEIINAMGERLLMEMKVNKSSINHSEPELKQKVDELVSFFEKKGNYPELSETKTTYTLKIHNCLLYDIAKDDPSVCGINEIIIDGITDVKVVRTKCIRNGDDACVYSINKNLKTKESRKE